MYIYILMCFIYMKSRLFWSKIYIIFLYYFVQVILIKSYLQCRKICWGSKNLYIFFCKDIPVYDERGDQQWGFYDLPQKLKLNIVNIQKSLELLNYTKRNLLLCEVCLHNKYWSNCLKFLTHRKVHNLYIFFD